MFAFHLSQHNITKRILGSWLGKRGRLSFVRIELVDIDAKGVWEYKVDAFGYRIDLFLHQDGRVYGRLWCYGTIGATSSTLAGFCSLINNCKRWAGK